MKSKSSKKLQRVIGIAAALIMLIQISLALVWMAKNIHSMPGFGDSGEYIDLSQNFGLDEYRPIGYPFIIRCLTTLGGMIGKDWRVGLYLGQLICSGFASVFLVCTLDRINRWRMRWYTKCLLALYLVSIPMITWMNFSVLTDSLALSALLVMIACLARVTYLDLTTGMKVLTWLVVAITYMIQALLRADRYYSILVFIIFIVLRMVRIRRRRAGGGKNGNGKAVGFKELGCIVLCVLIAAAAVRMIDAKTQVKGRNGRITTTMDFVLLDRVVWPNMRRNYEHFSEEIRSLVSKDDAKTFDKHNNNVMYQLAPMLEEKVGHEEAQRIYREMAATVWKYDKKLVMQQISGDLLKFVGFPVEGIWIYQKKIKVNKGWNVKVCSETSPVLTPRMELFYFYTLLGMLIAAIVSWLVGRGSRRAGTAGAEEKNGWKGIGMLFGMTVLFSLWFGLGDGAPPNDRYALIGYVAWTTAIAANLLTCGDRK